MTLAEISRIAPPTGRRRQHVWLWKVTRVLVGTLHAISWAYGLVLRNFVLRDMDKADHIDEKTGLCTQCNTTDQWRFQVSSRVEIACLGDHQKPHP